MFKKSLPVFLLAESPVHVGSGTELGLVDLPIQREKHTGFPKIEASGIKGCVRESFGSQGGLEKLKDLVGEDLDKKRLKNLTEQIFGPEEGDLYSGALGFTDARLLAFPVKSMKGVFAWITCPYALERLRDDLAMAGIKMPEVPPAGAVCDDSTVVFKRGDDKLKAVLEEYTFEVEGHTKCSELANWLSEILFKANGDEAGTLAYWSKKMRASLVVLPDDDFRDFAELSTEVVARTRIDEGTGTVATGALFYEEYLPQESILYTLAIASPLFLKEAQKDPYFKNGNDDEESRILDLLKEGVPEIIQIGGNATIGKGLVRLSFLEV